MFTILLVLNIILILISIIFVFKIIFPILLDIKIYEIIMIIIFYLFSISLLMLAINSITLAEEFPSVFYERGGSAGGIIGIDVFSFTIMAILYLYKKIVVKKTDLKIQKEFDEESHIKWNNWYKSKE